jgi:hypothetical protein
MPRTRPIASEILRAYATSAEFCKVFTENMDSMYLLSFLLTVDLSKAEECFVSGLEDCVAGSGVFREWAQSWARRTIIQNAVRLLAPRKNHSAVAEVRSNAVSCSFGLPPPAGYAIASILGLEDFERFVFVMTILEKYADHDCAVILGCSRQDIAEARMRALLHVAESGGRSPLIRATFESKEDEETGTREIRMQPGVQ